MDSSTSKNHLGEKIRKFRKRAGMSQMELELAIGASSGSISRIENGSVNPTKETLSKVAEILNLSSYQITDILGIRIDTQLELIKAINKFSDNLSLNQILQTAVDLMFDLFPNYNGGVIFMNYGSKIYSKTVSNMPAMSNALKYIPKPVRQLNVDMVPTSKNFVVNSILENKVKESTDLYDFIRGAVNKLGVKAIARILKFQVGISIPLRYEREIIGAVLYTKRDEDAFTEREIELLQLLNDQLAIAIMNARKFQELELKLHVLDNIE